MLEWFLNGLVNALSGMVLMCSLDWSWGGTCLRGLFSFTVWGLRWHFFLVISVCLSVFLSFGRSFLLSFDILVFKIKARVLTQGLSN